MTAVEDALSSKFLHSEGPNSVWKVQGGDHSTFECKVPESHSSQQRRVTSNDYQLVSQSAKSSNSGPIYHVSFGPQKALTLRTPLPSRIKIFGE